MKLSLPALETLAVIAYKQPVTAPEVNEIRGVDSSGVFGSLLARKLITTAGRKQVIGRPILYKTTKEFLMRFGLKDVNELPSMDEFEKMASELEETEPTPITDAEAADAAYDAEGSAGPELDENAPEEADDDSTSPAETSTQTPKPASESNEQTEPPNRLAFRTWPRLTGNEAGRTEISMTKKARRLPDPQNPISPNLPALNLMAP